MYMHFYMIQERDGLNRGYSELHAGGRGWRSPLYAPYTFHSTPHGLFCAGIDDSDSCAPQRETRGAARERCQGALAETRTR